MPIAWNFHLQTFGNLTKSLPKLQIVLHSCCCCCYTSANGTIVENAPKNTAPILSIESLHPHTHTHRHSHKFILIALFTTWGCAWKISEHKTQEQNKQTKHKHNKSCRHCCWWWWQHKQRHILVDRQLQLHPSMVSWTTQHRERETERVSEWQTSNSCSTLATTTA